MLKILKSDRGSKQYLGRLRNLSASSKSYVVMRGENPNFDWRKAMYRTRSTCLTNMISITRIYGNMSTDLMIDLS
jgi:hypothetical protein